MEERYDIVVVGAGLAGLVAAERLAVRGYRVQVLEAAEEVGGRTRSRRVGEATFELGAEWVGGRHRNVLALLRRLGLTTRRTHQLVAPILWRPPGGAERMVFPGPPSSAPGLIRAYAGLRRLSRRVDPDAPWSSPGATELDRIDVGSWFAAQGMRPEELHLCEKVIGGLTSTGLHQLSLLHLLAWIHRAGGTLHTIWTTFERHVPGGTQEAARRLAASLGDAVRLGAPVAELVQDGTIEAVVADGTRVRARAAVVAVPLGTVPAITFDPPLAPEQARLNELAIRPATKAIALLPRGARPVHRVAVGGDPLDGAWRVGRRVTGFASPPHNDAPDADLLADLGSAFRVDPAELRHPQVFRWSDRAWVPGCDVGFAPGQLTELGPHLRRPHGRVHFAGTERSSWPNNMEGAVETGLRAAVAAARELEA